MYTMPSGTNFMLNKQIVCIYSAYATASRSVIICPTERDVPLSCPPSVLNYLSLILDLCPGKRLNKKMISS